MGFGQMAFYNIYLCDQECKGEEDSYRWFLTVFQLQANLAIDENARVVLKPRNRLKHTLGIKTLSSKPGPKPIKKQLETTAKDGDLTN